MLFAQERVPRALGIDAARAGYELTVLEKESEPPRVEVESWAAGATKSTFDSLPFTELTSWFGIDAKDIWAAGSLPDGTFAFSHFDGKLWTETPRRFSEALSSLAVPKSDSGPPARRYFLSGKRWYELVETSSSSTRCRMNVRCWR